MEIELRQPHHEPLPTPEVIIPPAPELQQLQQLRPISFYVQHLRHLIPAEMWVPNNKRLLWFFSYFAVAVTSLVVIKNINPSLPIKLLLSIMAGLSFGALAFFAHEALHGSVVRNRKAQDILGFIGFMPFFISPTFWRLWHNRLHHGNTQAIITDPDAFPTLKIFKHSKFMRFMYPFTPGSGHKRSYLYFFFWFSFHILVAQFYLRFRNKQFDGLNHKRVTLEMSAQIIIWMALLYWLGPANLVWTFVIPFMLQNYLTMSYVSTNHNLNPLTRTNDPLVNSLSVTNHPILEWLHLNFGYHVEHHIFPAINGKHAKDISHILKSEFGPAYLIMEKTQAMKLLYQTARIYKNSKTLIHPKTLETFDCLKSEF